jgi:WD40 repeat protein
MTDAADNQPDPLDAVVEDFLARRRAGECASAEDFARCHPDLADRIRVLFPTLLLLERRSLPSDPTPASVVALRIQGPVVPPGALGPFRILREVARGGMGVIYEAIQEPLGRRVALKVLPPELGRQPAYRERFGREAAAAARLHHTNIVPVFASGAQDDTLYFAMQFIQGRTVADLLADLRAAGTHPPDHAHQAARLALQAAEALACAHAHGILHRDIKPSNLLVDREGRLWVADFGLAKARDGDDLTSPGELVGTLRYLAPERFAGRCDARSDVYALGATLYELLALRPAFDDTDRLRLVRQVAGGAPALARIAPGVPGNLATVVHKAMAADPADRYPTAQELADDLRRFLDDLPVRARRESALETVRRWSRHNVALARMTGAVAALLVLTALATSLLSLRALRAEARMEEKLFESRLVEARALTLSRRPGQHFASLALLDEARALAQKLGLEADRWHELRNATVAALALPDLYPERTWEGLPNGSTYVSFDERLEVYARTDRWGNCSVRRVEDDQELYALPAPEPPPPEGLECIPFLSPDARFVAVRHVDHRLHVWKLAGTRPELWLRDEKIRRVDWRSDGGTIGWTDQDGTLSVHELASRRRVARLPPDGITRAVFPALHPTEPLVALTSELANEAQVRDLRSGKVLKSLPLPRGGYMVGWDPSGRTLAASDANGNFIHCYDRETFQERGHIGPIEGGRPRFFFNHAGDRVAAYSLRNATELHNAITSQKLISVPNLQPVYLLRFSRDDTRLAGFGHAGRLGIWRVANHPVRKTLALPRANAFSGGLPPAISPDGRVVADVMVDGIHMWDLETGRELASLPYQVSEREFQFVLFEPGPSAALLTGTGAGTFRWPWRAVAPDHWRLGPPQAVALPSGRAASQSRDGQVLATGVQDAPEVMTAWSGAWIWHADRPDVPLHVAAGNNIRSLAVSPNGSWLATGDRFRHVVELWDARTGKLVRKLLDHYAVPTFSPDGAWLAVGSDENTGLCDPQSGRLFATDTWEAVRPLDSAAVFAPDSRTMLLTTDTSALRLVETLSGRELVRIQSPDVERSRVPQLTPDGTRLIVADDSTGLHVWDLRRLRAELASRDLDWDAPPCAPAPPPHGPVTLEVIWGDYERLSRQELARNYDRGVEAAPQRGERWYCRGIFHLRSGRHERALADLRKAVALEPDLAPFCHALARFYATAPERYRDIPAAVSLAERAVALLPDEWSYISTQGIAYYRAGRHGDALAALQKNLARGTAEAQAVDLYFLALCHRSLGDAKRADECFQRARTLHEQQRNRLSPEEAEELRSFRAEAEALLARSARDGSAASGPTGP